MVGRFFARDIYKWCACLNDEEMKNECLKAKEESVISQIEKESGVKYDLLDDRAKDYYKKFISDKLLILDYLCCMRDIDLDK